MRRLHVTPNNPFEAWYSRTLRQVELNPFAILHGISIRPPRVLLSNQGQACGPLPLSTLFLVSSHHDHFILRPNLVTRNISFHTLQPREYCGPLALTDRVLVHLPYQASTMALWENLGQGVVYLLPSIRLMETEILPLRTCCLLPRDIHALGQPAAQYLNWTDWYYYTHLFLYFDDWEELRDVVNIRHDIIAAHRQHVYRWMQKQDIIMLRHWMSLLVP